jgi:hypothetical protein
MIYFFCLRVYILRRVVVFLFLLRRLDATRFCVLLLFFIAPPVVYFVLFLSVDDFVSLVRRLVAVDLSEDVEDVEEFSRLLTTFIALSGCVVSFDSYDNNSLI